MTGVLFSICGDMIYTHTHTHTYNSPFRWLIFSVVYSHRAEASLDLISMQWAAVPLQSYPIVSEGSFWKPIWLIFLLGTIVFIVT